MLTIILISIIIGCIFAYNNPGKSIAGESFKVFLTIFAMLVVLFMIIGFLIFGCVMLII